MVIYRLFFFSKQTNQGILLSACCMIVWFMHKCTEFPLLIVMKLTNARHGYVQISDTEFHSNQTVSEENMEVDLCP